MMTMNNWRYFLLSGKVLKNWQDFLKSRNNDYVELGG